MVREIFLNCLNLFFWKIQIVVECKFVRDMLKGEESNEIQVLFKSQLEKNDLDKSFNG